MNISADKANESHPLEDRKDAKAYALEMIGDGSGWESVEQLQTRLDTVNQHLGSGFYRDPAAKGRSTDAISYVCGVRLDGLPDEHGRRELVILLGSARGEVDDKEKIAWRVFIDNGDLADGVLPGSSHFDHTVALEQQRRAEAIHRATQNDEQT